MYLQRASQQKTVYAGTSCTGTSGTANRTLVHSKALLAGSLVIVGRSVLIHGAGKDYTVSGATITFLNPIFNDDTIMVFA